MITLDVAANARLTNRIKGVTWLVSLDFRTQPIYYNTSSETLPIDETEYGGLGALTDISQIHESDSTSPSKVNLSFALTKRALLAATIGDAGEYRGRRVKIYMQLLTDTFQPVGGKVLRWSGYMDKVSVDKSKSANGFEGKIKLSCSKPGINRARNAIGLRITHSQRQITHPTDLGTEYLQELIENPTLWLSKKFQEQT